MFANMILKNKVKAVNKANICFFAFSVQQFKEVFSGVKEDFDKRTGRISPFLPTFRQTFSSMFILTEQLCFSLSDITDHLVSNAVITLPSDAS